MHVLNALFLILLFLAVDIALIMAVWIALSIFTKLTKLRYQIPFLALATICTICCVLVVFIQYSIGIQPERIFKRQFGFEPPLTVRFIEARQYVLSDYGEVSMEFTTDKSTLNDIISRGMTRRSDIGQKHHYTRSFSDEFSTETEELYFNPRTTKVRYFWYGID